MSTPTSPARAPLSPDPVHDPDLTPRQRAQARLDASRARLRRQLLPPPPAARPRPRGPSAFAGMVSSMGSRPLAWLRDLAGRHPVGRAIADGLGQWWEHHPLRGTAELAGSELAAEWRRSGIPLLQRHPLASVAMAAAAGYALVSSRRRWTPQLSQRLRPVPRRLGRWVFAQVPLQSVLTGLAVALASRSMPADEGAPPVRDPAVLEP
jgi:hypothetical protein